MHEPTQQFNFRIPTHLLERAKMTILERRLRGGVTSMICDALEAYLDDLDKVPLTFTALWTRQKGYLPSDAEKVRSYGGQYEIPKLFRTPRDHFTLEELRQHFLTGVYDSRTAKLIYLQQQEWITRGEPLVAMPIHPPGWTGYPPLPKPQAEDESDELADDDIG